MSALVECHDMKILLVLSHKKPTNSLLNKFIIASSYPAFTLEQLVSITPGNHVVEYLDERLRPVDFTWDGDVVGISTTTINATHAYELADEFRRRGKTVVLGGYHPSALPDEAKHHADSVIIGEAETSWPRLLKDLEKNSLKHLYRSKPVDPTLIPSPTHLPEYDASTGIVQATRGCPYACKYCAVQNVEGCLFRARPIPNVIKEIQRLKQTRFYFADGSMTINSTYTKQLFEAMRELHKRFSCFGNINVLQADEELLRLAREAGCEQWQIGFESISQETLHAIGKKTNTVDKYADAVEKIHEHGMEVMGLFMFGFDTDTTHVFDATLEAVNTMRLERAGFAILTPYPGTALFKELMRKKRILTNDWSKYDLRHVVFQPKNMTVEQLQDGTRSLSKEFYSFSNCLRRSFHGNDWTIHRFMNRMMGDYFLSKFYQI